MPRSCATALSVWLWATCTSLCCFFSPALASASCLFRLSTSSSSCAAPSPVHACLSWQPLLGRTLQDNHAINELQVRALQASAIVLLRVAHLYASLNNSMLTVAGALSVPAQLEDLHHAC